MKLNRLVILPAVLLPLFCVARAQTQPVQSMASIFTNAAANQPAPPERRTSIIYIQCHGLGYGDLSCYGQTNFQTPNLDALAAKGLRFTNFRPGGTNFTDSLAALVFGKKPAGVATLTVAEQLQAAGYHTGLLGEWTLDDHPWTRGFDEFAGFFGPDDGRNYFADRLWRFDPINTYDPAIHEWTDWKPGGPHNGGPEVLYPNIGGKRGQYLPELFVSAMCNFVRINKPDEFNHFRPFFLLVDLPVPRSASPFKDEFPVPSDAPFTEENWPQAAKDRAALITRIDGGIGRLLEQFRELGISNNVAIFFTSSESPENFKDAKLNFLSPHGTAQPGAQGGPAPLPMIVSWPDEIPAGAVSSFKWTGADFLPTAMEMSYAKPLKEIKGLSIVPVLRGHRGPEGDLPESNRAF